MANMANKTYKGYEIQETESGQRIYKDGTFITAVGSFAKSTPEKTIDGLLPAVVAESVAEVEATEETEPVAEKETKPATTKKTAVKK
jgi:hypothetical protein